MKKHVLIRYRWKNRDEERWLFLLEKKIKALGCEVVISPIDSFNSGSDWNAFVTRIQKSHEISDQNTYIVQHDPGSLTILKYLEFLVAHNIPQTVLLVAGVNNKPEPKSFLNPTSSGSGLFLKTGAYQEHGLDQAQTAIQKSTPGSLSQYRDKEILKSIDTRLVVLYTQEADALPEQQRKFLNA